MIRRPKQIAVREHYPRQMVELAKHRTAAILQATSHYDVSLRDLAASCYMQGLCDAVDAMTRPATPHHTLTEEE